MGKGAKRDRIGRLGITGTVVYLLGSLWGCTPAEPPAREFRVEATPARLERGRYLVENVAKCFLCHSEVDWENTGEPMPGTKGGGGLIPDEVLPFKVYGPNISPDPETGGGTWTDEQFARAIREGIGNDGRTLFPLMAYPFFRTMSDEDLAAVIAYVRSIPPVRNEVPQTELPEEIKQALEPMPLTGPVPPPDFSDPVQRGAYLAALAECAACHTPLDAQFLPLPGMDFSGGQPLKGPWGDVASANITPDPSGISYYDEAFFMKTIRTGRVGGVRELNHIMPWKSFRNMTDEDLKAIFAYLRTLTPVQHRVDNAEPPTDCPRCGGTHGYGERNFVSQTSAP
ncbi:MAG: c-type cytochrome [Terriglobia bacterium]